MVLYSSVVSFGMPALSAITYGYRSLTYPRFGVYWRW